MLLKVNSDPFCTTAIMMYLRYFSYITNYQDWKMRKRGEFFLNIFPPTKNNRSAQDEER